MVLAQQIDQPDVPPTGGGSFSWGGLALALLSVPVIGLALGWTATVVQGYFAPAILFPLLLGICTGMIVVGLVRMAQIGNRSTIVAATVLAATLAAASQHYLVYLSTYYWPAPSLDAGSAGGRDWSALVWKVAPTFGQYVQSQAARGRPLLFGFVAQGWVAWLSWAIDALLVVAAAVAVTIPAMRVPYCNRCRTWYRTTRGGRIDVLTAQRLAVLVGVEEINNARSHRYRLSNCLGGCGPTRLELSWEEADGTVNLVRLWLDPATRNQLSAILDGLPDENQDPADGES